MIKLKHFIVWDSIRAGRVVQFRTSHIAMEKLVNKIINDRFYRPGSLTVVVGTEVLTPQTGQELL